MIAMYLDMVVLGHSNSIVLLWYWTREPTHCGYISFFSWHRWLGHFVRKAYLVMSYGWILTTWMVSDVSHLTMYDSYYSILFPMLWVKFIMWQIYHAKELHNSWSDQQMQIKFETGNILSTMYMKCLSIDNFAYDKYMLPSLSLPTPNNVARYRYLFFFVH